MTTLLAVTTNGGTKYHAVAGEDRPTLCGNDLWFQGKRPFDDVPVDARCRRCQVAAEKIGNR